MLYILCLLSMAVYYNPSMDNEAADFTEFFSHERVVQWLYKNEWVLWSWAERNVICHKGLKNLFRIKENVKSKLEVNISIQAQYFL